MKVLILYAHPNPNSFCSAIRQRVEETLSKKGIDYKVRDLYQMRFNPTLSGEELVALSQGRVLDDVKAEQELIKESDTLIFIFPMWWYSFPAILKGYIDRVFSYGFAYAEEDGQIKGLLKEKRALVLCTLGGTEEDYGDFAHCVESVFRNTFTFCGIDVPLVKFFYAVPYVSHEERLKYLEEVETIVRDLTQT